MRGTRRVRLLAAAATAGGILTAVTAAPAQESPRTRAEATGYRETSRYADVVAFLDALDAASPAIHRLDFGYTFEGRALPLVVWDPAAVPGAYDAVAAIRERAGDRLKVLVFANIHAGEVEGKEASLVLLRDLVEGAHRAWADSLVLLVAPIYNADGNERINLTNRPLQHGPVGGMGQRPNAQGLDLNRDFGKLDAPESRSLVGLLRDADPHLVVDLHTTNGTRHGYHLTYAPPLHPDTDPAIDRFMRETWLPAVSAAIAPGWDAYYYGNLPDAGVDGAEDEAAPRGWYTFDPRPRFGTNYVGLRNRFAILSEAYSRLTFEDRIAVTKRFVEAILDFAHARSSEIRRRVAEADARDVVGRPLAVRSAHARTGEDVEILLGEVEEVPHPYTGEPMLLRADVQIPERMDEYGGFRASESVPAPAAYLVPPELGEAIEILAVHGVRAEPLSADRRYDVEVFRIAAARTAEEPFQGHRQRELEGEWVAAPGRVVPAGTLVVPMDQPLARLAFVLLEPRSDDGLAAWNVLEAALEGAETYPIRRVPARSRERR